MITKRDFVNTATVSGIVEKAPAVMDSKFGDGQFTYFTLVQKYETRNGLKATYLDCQYKGNIYDIISPDDVGNPNVVLNLTGSLVVRKKKTKSGEDYYSTGISASNITVSVGGKPRTGSQSLKHIEVKSPVNEDADLPF